jgi:two-component system sensor histidine kinase UhpB
MKPNPPVRMAQPGLIAPTRVFVLVLAVVFSVELCIMLALTAIPTSYRESLALSLIDSALLVAVLCPALWLLIVRPLRALVAERGALLSRSFSVQEAERARLSRDLHDELGQAQTAVLLGLRTILNSGTHDEAIERAQTVHQIASAAVESTRRIARGLTSPVLRDFGLGQAVDRVCEDIAAASGIEILHDLAIGSVRLDPAIEIAVYRLAQEAITNAAKHAGATQIRVDLRLSNGRLSISIADNGRGLPGNAGAGLGSGDGLGLAGMRERVVLLGGDFRIGSVPPAGTMVRADIPLQQIPT